MFQFKIRDLLLVTLAAALQLAVYRYSAEIFCVMLTFSVVPLFWSCQGLSINLPCPQKT